MKKLYNMDSYTFKMHIWSKSVFSLEEYFIGHIMLL